LNRQDLHSRKQGAQPAIQHQPLQPLAFITSERALRQKWLSQSHQADEPKYLAWEMSS
jgi:hypothetical protein